MIGLSTESERGMNMYFRVLFSFGISFGMGLGSGCATPMAVPSLFSPTLVEKPNEAWARVLHANVDNSGVIDFSGVNSSRQDLDAFVYSVSQESPASAPEKFPGLYAKVAYYLNSYNALAMYNVLESGFPENLGGWMTLKFFVLKTLDVGGQYMSLSDYENNVIRPLGEERVNFALNCMVKGCPRLPNVPFTADHLDAELDAAAKLFLNEERNVKVDDSQKTVYLSSILKFYTRDFTKKAPSLLSYVNRYRKQRIPEDYRVSFIPYDWTLNNRRTQ